MFDTLLIANRGEIACRVMRTARALGMRCVAVYSDADRDAAHVELADEAYRLGPAAAAESYLRGDRIIEAALASGARAIHPGYGFLSENPEFVVACERAGLVFIGPPATAIRAMGLKDAAKRLMQEAGVPVVPGYHGAEQDPALLAERADEIGYPVLIKPRAGGGGKGMRRVAAPHEFAAALGGAQREARSSFGDDRVLIEKYLATPRHIEMQVFADTLGNTVHLFERDCSLQRRHQKVIEEAPAPGMTEALRETMGAAAVRAAEAVGYVGAGTVEFIVDASEGLREDRFYFLEMNTRLQVEHPVTECITGLDLVEWQLRIAAGEPLPLGQSELTIDGHAFEARIYAEDPAEGFLPATGRLEYLRLPETRARIDAGVREGDAITPYYDPMIAKLIVHGPTRRSALNALAVALADARVAGCTTNLAFLSRLAAQPDFVRGAVDTGLIERHLAKLGADRAPREGVLALAALAALGFLRARDGDDPWTTLTGWRHWSDAKQYAHLAWGDETREVEVVSRSGGLAEVDPGSGTLTVQVLSVDDEEVRADIGGHIVRAHVLADTRTVTVFFGAETHRFELPDQLAERDEQAADADLLLAPMPGAVKTINVRTGEAVEKGQTLVLMEAMKMELALAAPRSGRVTGIEIDSGDQVQEGAVLLRLGDAAVEEKS